MHHLLEIDTEEYKDHTRKKLLSLLEGVSLRLPPPDYSNRPSGPREEEPCLGEEPCWTHRTAGQILHPARIWRR